MSGVAGGLVANALAVAALAPLVWLAARRLRSPAWRHALWLLVILKLLTPPLFRVPVLAAPMPPARAVRAVEPAVEPAVEWVASEPGSEPAIDREAIVMPAVPARVSLLEALAAIWGVGSLIVIVVAVRRLAKFHGLMRSARPVPARLRRLMTPLGRRLGLRRLPRPRVLAAPVSPMLFAGLGRASLVVPERLARDLDDDRLAGVLAHELAHFARCDHVLRWFELAAVVVFWWHPMLWLARHGLHEAEEQACDRLAVSAMADRPRVYADAMLDVIDFVSESRAATPAAACGVGSVPSLQRRLTMIMQMTGGSGRLGRAGRVLLLLIGACILPVLPARTQDSRRSRTEAEREVVHEREALETQMKDMARKLTWFRQAIKEALKNRAREKAAVLATQAARLETELALAKHGLARMKLRRQSKKTDQFEEIEEEIEEIEKGDAPPEGAQARRGQDATERTILRGLRSLEQGKVEAAAEAMRQLLRLHRSQKTRESRPGPVERWRGGQGRTDRNRMRELETQVRRLNRIVEELSRQIRGRRRSGRDR